MKIRHARTRIRAAPLWARLRERGVQSRHGQDASAMVRGIGFLQMRPMLPMRIPVSTFKREVFIVA